MGGRSRRLAAPHSVRCAKGRLLQSSTMSQVWSYANMPHDSCVSLLQLWGYCKSKKWNYVAAWHGGSTAKVLPLMEAVCHACEEYFRPDTRAELTCVNAYLQLW